MRVAFDYQIFSLQAHGGISRYFTRLASHLDALQECVKVFAPLHCNEYLGALSPSLRYGLSVDQNFSKLLRAAIPLNQYLCNRKIVRWNPDIVHRTYFSIFTNRAVKCPAVLTVYDMVHELFPDEFSRIGRLSDHKRKAVERADHIICISENTRKDLINLFNVPEEKTSVVYLGFDRLAGEDTEAGLRSHPGVQRPFLLFVGKRGGYKNFSGLLRAVSLSSVLKADFDVVAFGGGGFTRQEYALMESLGLERGRVRQVGGDDSMLGALYRSASAFVYPSLYEGFGLPPLEAMAHGCPVIVANTSSLPEVVGEAGEYFDPASPESMAAAIERVVDSSEHAALLRTRGAEQLKKFSWAACARETREVYRKLRV